ncbi:MAG: Transcriptional regulator PA2737, MerR family [uncultured Sphingomonadaceae bacterium]|uniref:Transcriptional regulator PA2737, MerR family n=1 Tax=uncultured Sphingomonadaceae bacterium TaxID=169976 RepID=A0A6J4STG7_9SPHN|nr:MAG: Transcriptional regulator PA2737, MerR family [uncultured Sphingomonadaceae bacterium]
MSDSVLEGADGGIGAPASSRQAVVKEGTAFRTIGELAAELGIPQHILRYWETRFPQLRPLQRAGNRRYYRPADVALARRIHHLLEEEHYTIKGVQRLLAGKPAEPEVPTASAPPAAVPVAPTPQNQHAGIPPERLARVRTLLAEALAEDAA